MSKGFVNVMMDGLVIVVSHGLVHAMSGALHVLDPLQAIAFPVVRMHIDIKGAASASLDGTHNQRHKIAYSQS